MECPSCKNSFESAGSNQNFCGRCGFKLPDHFWEPLKESINIPSGESKSPTNPSEPSSQDTDDPLCSGYVQDTGRPSYETETLRAAEKEYHDLVKEAFKSGSITPDDLYLLARRKEELGLDSDKAIRIQKSIAEELKLAIDQQSSQSFCYLRMEMNINMVCCIEKSCHLEFKFINDSNESLSNIRVKGKFLHLKTSEESDRHERSLPPHSGRSSRKAKVISSSLRKGLAPRLLGRSRPSQMHPVEGCSSASPTTDPSSV
jgi:hypothetical protein